MKESVYSGNIIPLVEDAHVHNDCYEVSKEIAVAVKNSMNSVAYEELSEFCNNADWVYSGYSLRKDYIGCWRNALDKNSIRMFNKVQKSSAEYPVMWILFYDEEERERAACNQRIVIEDAVEVTVNKDVQIEINVAKFVDINEHINYLSMMSSIAHELQHIFDMYVLAERDFTKDNKDNPYYDFIENNILGESSSNVYKLIESLLYVISHNEQRGFLSELRTFLKGVGDNDELKHKLFVDDVRHKNDRNKYPLIKNRNQFDEETLIAYVRNKLIVNNMTRCSSMSIINSILMKLHIREPGRYAFVLMNVGYYMFRHNMLRLSKYNISRATANAIFSMDELNVHLDFKKRVVRDKIPQDILELIRHSVSYEFDRYKRTVDNEIHKHLHSIFNYEKIIDVPENYYGNFPKDILEKFKLREEIMLYD